MNRPGRGSASRITATITAPPSHSQLWSCSRHRFPHGAASHLHRKTKMRSTLHPAPLCVLTLAVGGSLAYLWFGPHAAAAPAQRAKTLISWPKAAESPASPNANRGTDLELPPAALPADKLDQAAKQPPR